MNKKIAQLKRFGMSWGVLVVTLVLQASLATVAYAQTPGGGTSGGGGGAQTATQSDLINLVTNMAQFGAVGVGIVVVAMMGWAGFRYLSAGDNANQVSEAKNQIFQALIALFLYLFALAILNWLTPGGLTGAGAGTGNEGEGEPRGPI